MRGTEFVLLRAKSPASGSVATELGDFPAWHRHNLGGFKSGSANHPFRFPGQFFPTLPILPLVKRCFAYLRSPHTRWK